MPALGWKFIHGSLNRIIFCFEKKKCSSQCSSNVGIDFSGLDCSNCLSSFSVQVTLIYSLLCLWHCLLHLHPKYCQISKLVKSMVGHELYQYLLQIQGRKTRVKISSILLQWPIGFCPCHLQIFII